MSENIITIDGRNLDFTSGETILEVARRNSIFIPTLCHLKGVQPSGACRVCVVEIEGGRGLSPACAMPAASKMIVHTNSPNVLEARRTILALLLLSGNHNCAIADKDAGKWAEFQLFGKWKNGIPAPEIANLFDLVKAKHLAHGDWHSLGIKECDTLEKAFELMMRLGEDVIPVLDEDGKIIGDLRLSEVLLKVIEVGRERKD